MALIAPKVWTRQPTGAVVPQWPGLTFFVDPANNIFWARNGGQRLTTNTRIITNPYAGTTNATIDNARREALYYNASGPASVLILCTFEGIPAADATNTYPVAITGTIRNTTNRGGLEIGVYGNPSQANFTRNNFFVICRSNTYQAEQTSIASTELVVANKLYLLLHRNNGSSTAQFVANGNVYSHSTFAPPGPNTTDPLTFGYNTIAGLGVRVYYMAKFDRWMPDGEYKRLLANPWQILRPIELSVPTYYPAAFPTLSNARMTSLTGTQGVPNVDYAF